MDKSPSIVDEIWTAYPGNPRRIRPEDPSPEVVRARKLIPANTSPVLEIPTVNVIELGEVLILARHKANSLDCRHPRPQQKHITQFDLRGEPPHKAPLEVRILPVFVPGSAISGSDECHPAMEEDTHIGPV
jgi:hypothetical protein